MALCRTSHDFNVFVNKNIKMVIFRFWNMGHENIWFSHKGKNTSGKGLRHCRVQGGRAVGLIKKYGLNMSRQAFRENAALIGFKKLD